MTQEGNTVATQSAGRRQTARTQAKKSEENSPKQEPVDPELQGLLDLENANIQIVQQNALIEHLKGRVVALHKEILALKK